MFELLKMYQLDIMLALSAACISFALLLFFTQFLEKKRKLILIMMELIATFLLFSDRMAYIYAGDTSRNGYIMVRVSNFFVFFLTSGIVWEFNQFLIDLINEVDKNKKIPLILRIVSWASVFGMLLVVISQFTGLYYYFDDYNKYHRGSAFLLSYMIPVLGPLFQYFVIRKYRKKFSNLIYISLILYIFIPIIAGIVQIFYYGVSIVNMAMVLVSISLYIFTYLDINRTVLRAHYIEVGELKEGEKKMKRLFDQTTNAFVCALEKKDVYLKGYSSKVANVARKIAKEAGFDDKKCEEVYYAALLHNVGLFGIPDRIIENEDNLSDEDKKILKEKPVISGDILSVIEVYPYLKYGALYACERYDGTGYPERLKEKNIPEVARIIAVAEAYVSMTSPKRNREALPYITVRQSFVEKSGTRFDPEFAQIMLHIMDKEFASVQDTATMEEEILCNNYKDKVTLGSLLTDKVTKLSFTYDKTEFANEIFSSPTLLLFDSYDGRFHDEPRSIDAFKYSEYAEIWPDGHYISTMARNMEVSVKGQQDDSEVIKYEIRAAKYDDHVKVILSSEKRSVTGMLSLYDNSKSVYLGLTGEHCHIKDISVVETDEVVSESDFKRISDSISFIDRLESDLPNIQIDRTRSASTDGISIEDELRLYFHSMSLPSSNLVWHCPYLVLFYSSDGKVGGKEYKEYAIIKINGEISGDETCAKNSFSMKKKEDFKGWDLWKEKNRDGIECSVLLMKRANKVTVSTENLGIAIENTTTILDGAGEVYVALSGDEVAITDIRVMR